MTRRDEVILCRLRIGHTRLTHGFLMSRDNPPFCDDCLVQLTVRHIMVECPSFLDERKKYFSHAKESDEYSLSKILGCVSNVNNLFNFIKDIGILDKI